MVKKDLIEGEKWDEITRICKDAVKTMMKSLEFADDIAEAKTEAMDVKLDDIEIKR